MALEKAQLGNQFIYEMNLFEYLSTLYGRDKRKNATMFICENTMNADKTWLQKGFYIHNLDQAFDYLIGHDRMTDMYCTTNVHNSLYSRTTETVYSIPAIIFDLDFYKSKKYGDFKLSMLLEELEEQFFSKGIIPYPNGIVNSGGGCYLVWWFKFLPVDKERKLLTKRKVIMKILFELLKDFGADAKSLDHPHVFRFPQTKNSKNGNEVAAYFNALPEYNFSEFARSLPSLWDVWKTTRKIDLDSDKKRRKSKPKAPKSLSKKVVDFNSIVNRMYKQIESMFELAKLRNGECDGYREMMCFFVRDRYHSMYMHRFYAEDETLFEESFKKIQQLNKLFNNPLTDAELEKQTLNTKKLYKFKNDTLADWFDLTFDEQLAIDITTGDAKKEKSKRQMRNLRGSKEGHDEKKKRIEDYFKEHPDSSLKGAAKALEVSYNTVKKYAPQR